MVTIEDIERKRARLAAIIDPITRRSEERSEHSIWADEFTAIIAAIGAPLPLGWGDVSEQLARISDAGKMSQKRGADQKMFVGRLREGLARLEHAISVRRDFMADAGRAISISREDFISERSKFTVRLPEGIRERLAAIAGENRRSMNAELIVHLERGLRNSETLRIYEMKIAAQVESSAAAELALVEAVKNGTAANRG